MLDAPLLTVMLIAELILLYLDMPLSWTCCLTCFVNSGYAWWQFIADR